MLPVDSERQHVAAADGAFGFSGIGTYARSRASRPCRLEPRERG